MDDSDTEHSECSHEEIHRDDDEDEGIPPRQRYPLVLASRA